MLKKKREDRFKGVKYFGLDCIGSVYVYIVYLYKHLTGEGIIQYNVGGYYTCLSRMIPEFVMFPPPKLGWIIRKWIYIDKLIYNIYKDKRFY